MVQDATVAGVRRALEEASDWFEKERQEQVKYPEAAWMIAMRHHLAMERMIDMLERMERDLGELKTSLQQ